MPKSSTLCLDASLIVPRLTEAPDHFVQAWWDQRVTNDTHLVAPWLLRYEVTNAFHRLRRAGELTVHEATTALHQAIQLPIELRVESDLHQRALTFATRFNLSAAYDAHYLALADRLGVEFWTADRRLFNTVGRELPWVHLAGEVKAE